MKKFSVHPVSVIVWVWLFAVLGMIVSLNYILAVVIHELGHYFVAKMLGYKLTNFSLSPYGAELKYHEQNLDCKDEVKIALAGPLANLISAFLILALWWICPTIYFFTESFVSISVLLALINLLPAYPLDGGRLFVCFASNFFNSKIAVKVTKFMNLFLSVVFFVLFSICLFINFNPTLLLFAVFLVVGILDFNFITKYEKINIFCKTTKNFVKPVLCYVNLQTKLKELLSKMQTSKTYIFYTVLENGKVVNLSEKMIINLSLKFDLNTKLFDIFEK